MLKNTKVSVALAVVFLSVTCFLATDITVMAQNHKSYLDTLNAGVATIIDPSAYNSVDIMAATQEALEQEAERKAAELESNVVMANVQNAVNVRQDPGEDSEKVGKLYKDCGGTILERGDGWTKLQSGNLIGWASNEYLLFGEEAENLANEVGTLIAVNSSDGLRVRKEPSTDAGVYGVLGRDEIVDVIEELDGWVCIDYEGATGYVSAEYVSVEFNVDAGETLEEIKEREAEEAKAKLIANYGAVSADADTTILLAALIQCEAGSETYEGKLAVGAVVMNRVRSGAYPDSIHGVIYASGQFTPARTGKLDALYTSGKIQDECMQAAVEAINGSTNVGSATHFRRNNGTREGVVIGNHVFW